MIRHILLCFALIITTARSAYSDSPSEIRGRTFARVHCAQCHSIDRMSQSSLKIAPPLRTLHQRYPIETLAEALAEGISTGHPSMLEFRLEPDQINDQLPEEPRVSAQLLADISALTFCF